MRATLPLTVPCALVLLACGGGGAAAPAGTTPSSAATTDSTVPKPADHPESDKVTWKKDASSKTCHTGAKGDGDLVAAVTGIATGCADPKLHMLGQPITGEGAASTATMVKTVPLAAKANHCYRFFGLAVKAVTDLDVSIMDSAGKSAGEDLNDNNDAVVLENGSICFKADDAASINIAVAAGSGKWAVQVWSDQ